MSTRRHRPQVSIERMRSSAHERRLRHGGLSANAHAKAQKKGAIRQPMKMAQRVTRTAADLAGASMSDLGASKRPRDHRSEPKALAAQAMMYGSEGFIIWCSPFQVEVGFDDYPVSWADDGSTPWPNRARGLGPSACPDDHRVWSILMLTTGRSVRLPATLLTRARTERGGSAWPRGGTSLRGGSDRARRSSARARNGAAGTAAVTVRTTWSESCWTRQRTA